MESFYRQIGLEKKVKRGIFQATLPSFGEVSGSYQGDYVTVLTKKF